MNALVAIWNALVATVSRAKMIGTVAGRRMLVQVQMLNGEVKDGVELILPYGMSAIPNAGDVLVLTVGGTRDHMVAIAVDDSARRIRDLVAGEFGFSDGGQQIVFRTDRLDVGSKNPILVISDADVKVVGAAIVLKSAAGTERVLMDARMMTIFNNHVHTDPHGGFTGPPTTTLSAGSHTTTDTKAS